MYTIEVAESCGCEVRYHYESEARIVAYCPLHKAAPDMYKALKQWMVYLDTRDPANMIAKKHAYNLTEQALASAEGK